MGLGRLRGYSCAFAHALQVVKELGQPELSTLKDAAVSFLVSFFLYSQTPSFLASSAHNCVLVPQTHNFCK